MSVGPQMLSVQRNEGTWTSGIKMEVGPSITLANVREAATALQYMKPLDEFLFHDLPVPEADEAKTKYSEISEVIDAISFDLMQTAYISGLHLDTRASLPSSGLRRDCFKNSRADELGWSKRQYNS
ncbi:hypothetical protein FRC17_001738 [Serendipita sp. 399]|nr:hypothetical protein FRC17_001738 [Serendipita sp. 399]